MRKIKNIKAKRFIRVGQIVLGIVLMVVLTSTGVMEWLIFININRDRAEANTKSPLVAWIKKNTELEDVFLTPMWSFNRFSLAGRPMYYGWPYYAWSAGHDTDKRGGEYTRLLEGWNNDKEGFIAYCKEHHIKYIVDDPEMFDVRDDNTGRVYYNPDFVRDNFELVATFEKEDTRIYKVY